MVKDQYELNATGLYDLSEKEDARRMRSIFGVLSNPFLPFKVMGKAK